MPLDKRTRVAILILLRLVQWSAQCFWEKRILLDRWPFFPFYDMCRYNICNKATRIFAVCKFICIPSAIQQLLLISFRSLIQNSHFELWKYMLWCRHPGIRRAHYARDRLFLHVKPSFYIMQIAKLIKKKRNAWYAEPVCQINAWGIICCLVLVRKS